MSDKTPKNLKIKFIKARKEIGSHGSKWARQTSIGKSRKAQRVGQVL